MKIGRHSYGGHGSRKRGNALNIALFVLSSWGMLVYYVYKEDTTPTQAIVERVVYTGEKLKDEGMSEPHANSYNQSYSTTNSSYLTTTK